MPSLNRPVQRLKVAILPLDLPCSGPVTHSVEILTTGKSHGKKPDRFSIIIIIIIFMPRRNKIYFSDDSQAVPARPSGKGRL